MGPDVVTGSGSIRVCIGGFYRRKKSAANRTIPVELNRLVIEVLSAPVNVVLLPSDFTSVASNLARLHT